MRAARAGDYAALGALVDRYRPLVYGLARGVVRQPANAKDVTRQTLVSLVEHLVNFREEAGVAAWVFRIATNHALKLLRRSADPGTRWRAGTGHGAPPSGLSARSNLSMWPGPTGPSPGGSSAPVGR